MRFVLDSSVTMSWFFADEENAYAAAILESLNETDAIVPSIWPLEITNVLLVGERRGRQTVADTARFLAVLADLPISVDFSLQPCSMDQILSLGRQFGLSAYDASYLELAMREALPLATLDERLQCAASKAGVRLAVA